MSLFAPWSYSASEGDRFALVDRVGATRLQEECISAVQFKFASSLSASHR